MKTMVRQKKIESQKSGICGICGVKVVYNDRWGWRHKFNDGSIRTYNDYPAWHSASKMVIK